MEHGQGQNTKWTKHKGKINTYYIHKVFLKICNTAMHFTVYYTIRMQEKIKPNMVFSNICIVQSFELISIKILEALGIGSKQPLEVLSENQYLS